MEEWAAESSVSFTGGGGTAHVGTSREQIAAGCSQQVEATCASWLEEWLHLQLRLNIATYLKAWTMQSHCFIYEVYRKTSSSTAYIGKELHTLFIQIFWLFWYLD